MNRFASAKAARPLEQAGVSVWSWDQATGRFEMDGLGHELAGLFAGQDVVERMDRPSRTRLLRSLERCHALGQPVRVEVRCCAADGHWVWLDVRGGRLRWHGRDGESVSGVLWDITDSKLTAFALSAANTRLAAADRAKDRFIARLSHEMRTPLSALLGYADLALERAGDDAQRRDIHEIRSNGDFLLRLTDDLFDLSRIVANKVEIMLAEVSVGRLLADLQASFAMSAAAKGIDLSVEAAPGSPTTIVTDPVRLRQVLQNLVGNAVKFTDAGSVRLSVRRGARVGDTGILFEVRDTGPGIAPEDHGQIFEPFEQLQGDAVRRGGLGLGLSLCRHLTRHLGGDVSLQSAPGQGSSFFVWLPLEQDAEHRGHGGAAQTLSAGGLDGVRMLLVEDHRALAQLTRRQLERLGFEVRVVHDAAGAEASTQGWSPDAAVIDLGLPDADGIALLHRLRRMPGLAECRFVACSGSSDPADRHLALEAGFSAFLVKPVDPIQLAAALCPPALTLQA